MSPHARMRLLNPGPVTLTESVRRAQLGPDLCHREPEYADLQSDIRRRLANVYAPASKDYTAILVTGSGTAAVEAMVDSLVPRDGKALVVTNGVYGERMAAICRVHNKNFDVITSPWTQPMDLQQVEQRLQQDTAITHVVAVHHETTTGRLNDIEPLGAICRQYDVSLLLDAVSSFGGEQIDFAEWNLEACAATSNKCLHGVPGTAFVVVREDVFASRQSGANTLYLDLFGHRKAQDNGSTQFTPAVQCLYAFQAALSEFDEAGGWQARRARYRHLSGRLRQQLARAGFGLLLGDESVYSATLTSFSLPRGITFDALYKPLKGYGFVIYPGQKELKNTIFRVAVMGDLSLADMDEFAAALNGLVSISLRESVFAPQTEAQAEFGTV